MNIADGGQLQNLARDRRLELGLSQAAVAARAGVSRKWVSDFERGKTSVDLALVFRLLAALGLSVQVVQPGNRGPLSPSGRTIDLDALLGEVQPGR